MENKKRCSKCDELKSITEYHKKKGTPDGYRNECKECIKIYMLKYRKEHIEERKLYDEKRYEEKRKEILEYKKQYHVDNREIILEKKRKYRKENPHVIKNWRKDNSDKMSQYSKNYRDKYPHMVMWRSILYSTLKRLDTVKQCKTIDMLGYSAIELKDHLISLFTPGMTWDNYGEWEIDHIRAVSSFPSDTDVSIVCTLDNLQPLWKVSRVIEGVEYLGNLNKSNF